MTEWNASGYTNVSGLQAAIASEQLSRLKFQGSERILDLGCGNGTITAAIAERVPQGSVLGVDASQNMITFAQEHYGPATHPNLSFAVADVRDLPYQQEFDDIVSFNMLHWVPEQAAALCSICKALKPSGEALVRFVPEGERTCIEDVVEAVCHSPAWLAYFQTHTRPYYHPTPEDFQNLAQQNGLRVLRLQVEDKAWDFQTRQAFVDYCRVTLAEWTRYLPEAKWTDFITTVLDRYQAVAASNPAENNTFKFYQLEVGLAIE